FTLIQANVLAAKHVSSLVKTIKIWVSTVTSVVFTNT
ncbi:anaerobic dimethyl sulfoxide reductase chain A, partial [Vibrio parahaemolyticus AQ3810]